MKHTSIIAAIALATACLAPVATATPEMDEAVRLADRSSKAGLDAICLATYKAVKKTPDQADKIFEAVLGQRADWKSSEVYAIFRSVLLARPDLLDELRMLITVHRSSDKNGKNAAAPNSGATASVNAGGELIAAVSDTKTLSPMLSSLVTVLFDAALPGGVAEEALNMTVAVIAGTFAFAYEGAFDHVGGNTNMEGPSLDTMLEFVPTPEPVTKY